MSEKLRLGIVGCGKMMKSHVESVNYLDNVEVTAVCDVIKEQAEDVATVFDNPYVTTNWMDNIVAALGILNGVQHLINNLEWKSKSKGSLRY